MRVIGQGPDGCQPLGQREARLVAHHETGPAAHRVRSMGLADGRTGAAQRIEQQAGHAPHALQNAALAHLRRSGQHR